MQELYALDLNNNRQSAEQAAANLAAQLAASMAAPPVPQAPLPVAETGQALQAIEASASSVSAQNAPALNTLNPQSDNSTQALANQSMASTASIESQPDNLALGAALQAERAASTPSDAVNTLATSVSSLSSQPQASSVVFANAMANAVANGTGSNETGATQMGNVEALSNKASTTIETTVNIAANTNTPPVSSLVASAGALANAAPVAQAVQLAPVSTEKPLANQDLNADLSLSGLSTVLLLEFGFNFISHSYCVDMLLVPRLMRLLPALENFFCRQPNPCALWSHRQLDVGNS